jgi:hypothetical protein
MGDNFLKQQVRNFKKGRDKALEKLSQPTLYTTPETVGKTFPVFEANGQAVTTDDAMPLHFSVFTPFRRRKSLFLGPSTNREIRTYVKVQRHSFCPILASDRRKSLFLGRDCNQGIRTYDRSRTVELLLSHWTAGNDFPRGTAAIRMVGNLTAHTALRRLSPGEGL